MKTTIEDFTGRDWLFKHINNWLTNKTERFLILAGEPGVGLSAISTQLIRRNYLTAHHFCKIGDVQTTKSSYILRSLAVQLGENLPNYGQALASTIKPTDLKTQVNVCTDSMNGSEITKVYVQNLAANDPENELEILIRLPLTKLQQQATDVVILIDSLYEAGITGDENIIRLLAQLYNLELPDWVRFIFTSRPKDPLLREFTGVIPYHIENTSQENLADIWQYIEERLKQASFQKLLNQAPPANVISIGNLSSQIANYAKGNFLYTKLVIDNILAKKSINNLETLPHSIDEMYHNFLEGINRNECYSQNILGTLTVAQQPLTQEQLRNFIGIEIDKLLQCLEALHPLLDVNQDEEGNVTYTIFHESLRDYLLDQKRSGDFCCDAQQHHNLIIQHYKQDFTTWEEVDWASSDEYGLLHLVRHLDAARREQELYTLLTSSDKWMQAKFTVFSSHAAYLDDLELAINKFPKLLQPEQLRMLIKRYVALRSNTGGSIQGSSGRGNPERCTFYIQEEAPKL